MDDQEIIMLKLAMAFHNEFGPDSIEAKDLNKLLHPTNLKSTPKRA